MNELWEQLKSGALVDPENPIGALVYALFFILAAWLTGRALRLAFQRLVARDRRFYMDRTTVNFLAQLVQIGVYLFAFIYYAHLVPALRSLGNALLASVSVISVVVGLAAQSTLSNLVAGISLLLYRPFKVGDRLQVNAPSGLETGTVESLNLGYTVLKTDDNRRIVVPNSAMASQTTVNLTGEDPRVLCSVAFALSHDADVDRARALILELARQHPKAHEVLGCPVTQWNASGIVLTLSAWCLDPGQAAELKSELLEQVRKRFALEHIAVPLPESIVTLKPNRG